MAWFESSRFETVTYSFTLTAHHAGGGSYPSTNPVCEAGVSASGPLFEVKLYPLITSSEEGTSYFMLAILFPSSVAHTFRSQPISPPPATWDFTKSVTVSISYPARERKDVRIPGSSGVYDWLPSEVELQYALHPVPGSVITVETTSSDPALNQSITQSIAIFAIDFDLSPRLQVLTAMSAGKQAKNFTGLIAEVTSIQCTAAPLDFNDGGNPSSGFDVSSNNGRCFTTPNSMRLELTNAAGLNVGSAASTMYPKVDWGYDGWVKIFDDAYPAGDPVMIHDFPTDADYPAPGGHLTQSFPNRRRFAWNVTLQDVGGDIVNQSQQLNEHPAFIKAELQEAWTSGAGEDVNDRRLVLEDDKEWNAITLARQPVVVVDALDDADGWHYYLGSGTIESDIPAEAIKVVPAGDDNEIAKTVNHNFGTYRYLKIDLKCDQPATPVRVKLGSFYWDVLIETDQGFETKTIDLAAPHNATSLDDVAAVQTVTELRFGSLQRDTTYWLRNMRMERKDTDDADPPQTLPHRDELRILPPFQKDELLFHQCNARPGLTEKFRDSGALLSIQNVVTRINDRKDSGFVATASASSHPYYNPNAPAGFLVDLVKDNENVATWPITQKAQVRADRIIPWAGMGDPKQALPNNGTLTLKFTKRLHGKFEGLVFIRDLDAPDNITTRVQVRPIQSPADAKRTDKQRYYRTKDFKFAANYELVRIDENNTPGIPQKNLALVNREVKRVHLRARVWDRSLAVAIPDAVITLAFEETEEGDQNISNAAGFYALVPLPYKTASALSIYVDAYDFTDKVQQNLKLIGQPEKAIVDVDVSLDYAGAVQGTVVAAGGAPPIASGIVDARQTGIDAPGWGMAETDIDGAFVIYDLDIPTSSYGVSGDGPDKSLQSAAVSIGAPDHRHDITASQYFSLSPAAQVVGIVNDSTNDTVEGVTASALELDGTQTGLGADVTDPAGNYALTDLDAPGNYQITFDAVGYVPQGTQVNLVTGQSLQLNVTLQIVGVFVGTITSAGTELPIAQAEIIAEQTNGDMAGYGLGITLVQISE